MKDASGSAQNSPAGYRRHRRLVRLGQFLMVSGAVMIIIHWIAHLAPPGQGPSLTLDIYAGYPAGGLLILAGAVLAGRAEPKNK